MIWIIAGIVLVFAGFAFNGWRLDRHTHRYDTARIAAQYQAGVDQARRLAEAQVVAEAEDITRQAAP